MIRTDHPCKGMTTKQRETFEHIATGEALPPAHAKTIQRLLDDGLIQRDSDKPLGRDSFGSISIPQYSVPLAVHMQWCEWCSEQRGNAPGEGTTSEGGQ